METYYFTRRRRKPEEGAKRGRRGPTPHLGAGPPDPAPRAGVAHSVPSSPPAPSSPLRPAVTIVLDIALVLRETFPVLITIIVDACEWNHWIIVYV
jgi:hypothetical protein